jgi:fatty-acyl-CoA synthase
MAQLTPTIGSTLVASIKDGIRGFRNPEVRSAVASQAKFLGKSLRHTVPWIRRAQGDSDVSLLKVALHHAKETPFELAFEMDDERLTWAGLAEKTSRLAHVLAFHGVLDRDVVALIGTNSPGYIAFCLGISRLGGISALINHHLAGKPLAHAVATSGARVAIVEQELLESIASRKEVVDELDYVFVYRRFPADPKSELATPSQVDVLGARLVDLDAELANAPRESFPRVSIRAQDDYLYIYTSGTTGLPKPCRVSHARTVVGGAAYAVFFGFESGDKLYSALPLYHSSGMMLGAGSAIMGRTPMALRRSFSASAFWPDVKRYKATAMLYIGELARYLVNTPPCEDEKNNTIRVAVGNGLRPDVWEEFRDRFGIKHIREFYGATEAPGLIINLSDKAGSIGRLPLRRLTPMKLVRYDIENDEHPRDADGFCIECGPNEVGELVVKLEDKNQDAARSFKGYTDEEATKKKLLSGVFAAGDKFYRSGDLLRYDEDGFFYFADRIGDTYRWKGENVSTAEVADVISQMPGILGVTVSGVHVPGAEGQAGLAALVCENGFDPSSFWTVAQELPAYAQPRFIRLIEDLQTTGTFKVQKTHIRAAGCDPSTVKDSLFVRTDDSYIKLTKELWQDITAGRMHI